MYSRTYIQENKHHLTVVAALLAMVGPFTIDAYLPSFPDIESSFGISRAVLSQSLGIYLAAFAVSTLLWGPLSDRIGRRLVILIGLSIYFIASAGCALASDTGQFMFYRVLQGFSASGGFIASRAMIRDAHDSSGAHKAMSQVTLLFAISPAIAPVLGGWLHDHFGWRSVFWFLTGFGLLLVLMTALIEETLASDQRRSFHPSAVLNVYVGTLKHQRFPALVLSLAFSFAGAFIYIAGAPSVIYDFLGLGTNDFGLQFIPMVAGLMSGAFVSGRMAQRLKPARVVTIGFGIMALGVTLNLVQASLLAVSVVTVIGPLVVFVFGLAIVMPALTILALDCFPTHRGTAASMQGFIQMLVNSGVASIAVPLLHTKLQYFVLCQLGFVLMALLLWSFAKPLNEGQFD